MNIDRVALLLATLTFVSPISAVYAEARADLAVRDVWTDLSIVLVGQQFTIGTATVNLSSRDLGYRNTSLFLNGVKTDSSRCNYEANHLFRKLQADHLHGRPAYYSAGSGESRRFGSER